MDAAPAAASTGEAVITRSLRETINQVRALNHDFDGPGTVCLVAIDGNEFAEVMHMGSGYAEYGAEEIPGDDKPFDAVRVARRLLAAWRDWPEKDVDWHYNETGARK